MTRHIGYRRYGTPGEVIAVGPAEHAIVRTEYGVIPVTHARRALFGVGDRVVVFGDGIADVVPGTGAQFVHGVPVWVRFFAALAAPFRV